jgi:hypothetical protein
MAENKTLEERLAEIEAKNKAKEKAAKERAAKQKAAREKGKAAQEKRAKDAAAAAEKNRDSRDYKAPEKRLNPQTEAGKAAKTRQRIEQENKTNITSKYGQAYAKRESLLDSYRKTGDPKYRQLVINADNALERVVADYVKIYGYAPPKYTGKAKYPEPPKPVVKPGDKKTTPTSSGVTSPSASQARDAARSAGRNAAPPRVAPAVVAQVADPYIQGIIDTAAKANIQLSVAEATAAAAAGLGVSGGGGGGGRGSMASTQRQTTQYSLQQVRSAADSIYQNSIGRALNDEELRMLHQSLNKTLKVNPNITKTSAKGNVTTSGGIDERGFMEQQAQANPEFASYQKATTYFDSMLSSLQGPVGGGI